MKALPLEPGVIATSLAGRDQGRRFLVITALDEDYVMVADGDLRKIERPKKKKRKHLQATKERMECMPVGWPPKDHEIRRALAMPEEEG